MRASKIIFGAVTASALLAASISSAEAWGYRHRGPGPVLGLLGGVVMGAAAIATLPLRIVGDAVLSGPPDYYGPGEGYYGPPQRPYGDGYGYNYGDGGNYGPPPPPPPPPRYGRYGPPRGYYDYGY